MTPYYLVGTDRRFEGKCYLRHQGTCSSPTTVCIYQSVPCQTTEDNITLKLIQVFRSNNNTYSNIRFEIKRGRAPAEIVGSNPTGGMDICLL